MEDKIKKEIRRRERQWKLERVYGVIATWLLYFAVCGMAGMIVWQFVMNIFGKG